MSKTPTIGAMALAAVLAGCAESARGPAPPARQRPPRPAGAVAVPAGGPLQPHLDAAAAGAALALAPGVHHGPVRLTKPLTLWGEAGAVVRSSGAGSTVDVAAPGARLLGFTVDGSGSRFDLTDAAVRVRADDVQVVGLGVENALFGILVEKAARVEVRGNVVRGNGESSMGLRGDGIRLWEVRDSVVADNHVADSRDLVVWYASANRLIGNTVERSRYGTHFMYSHDNEVEDNRYLHNVVGVFVMYSRGISLRRNLIAHSGGASGLGLGLKESGNLKVLGNALLCNTTGIHSDNSPMNRDDHNRFEGNRLLACGTAVVFNGIAARTSFFGNSFRHNTAQVRVDGGDDAMGVTWSGNDFDDYRGYDLDGDGTGDVPYELRSYSTRLIGRYPELAFLEGMPALSMIDLSSRVMPLFSPKTVLVDRRPATVDPTEEVRHAR